MTHPIRILITLAATTLLGACSSAGVSDDVPLRTIGPDAQRKGIVSNDEGRIVLFDSEEKEAEQARDERVGGNDESYQEWKERREREEYEAWKREQEAKEQL